MVINLFNPLTIWRGDTLQTQGDLHQQQKIDIHPPREAPSLDSIMKSFGPFPIYSLVIGLCTDGLPFMLSLDNPKSGSILIVGENDYMKSQVFQTISVSASLINQPQSVYLCVITNKPKNYLGLLKSNHCQAILSPYERSSGEMVIEFASISEQRRSGRERGAAMMLLIDDYHSFAPQLENYSVYLNFKTLIANGPNSGIWPLVSINPMDVHSSKGQLLRSFGTYIFEKALSANANIPNSELVGSTDELYEPNFNVVIGGRLIPICSLSV